MTHGDPLAVLALLLLLLFSVISHHYFEIREIRCLNFSAVKVVSL